MGFYGNITNTTRTQFQFDRTYPNRYTMDKMVSGDGVYPGRFVLIEYDRSESFLKSIYLYNETPYTTIISKELDDKYNANQKLRVYGAPEDAAKYIVVDRKSFKSEESLLVIYSDEIIAVPAGQKITTQNENSKYIRFVDSSLIGYEEVTIDEYQGTLNYIKDSLIEKEIIFGDDGWTEIEASWKDKLKVYLVNGKFIFNNIEIFNEDFPITELIWEIQPHDEYTTNPYNLYYKLSVDDRDKDENGIYSKVTYIPISGADEKETPFVENFNIDRNWYKTSRGYDSTVWQKTFVDGIEKYVMVAELNTVVPTFDIINDAPTLLPLTPHFDGASTNVYYRLHWQPSWAIRTKAANKHHKGQAITSTGEFSPTGTVELTDDTIIYPSDQSTIWEGTFYNTIDNKVSNLYYNYHKNLWEEQQVDEDGKPLDYSLPAAIYYNKDGFNPEKVSESRFLCEENNPYRNPAIADSGWQPNEDKLGFFPTGKSGHMYNDHTYSLEGSPQVDTQEFVMMLPSLGNTMSSIWDLIFGGRNTNKTIESSFMRNMDIYWEDGKAVPERKGLRLAGYANGYNTTEVNTVAGAINSVHDLMGMIITSSATKANLENSMDSLSMDRLYYAKDTGEYYRKKKVYEYTEISNDEIQKGSLDSFYDKVDNGLIDFKKTYLSGDKPTVYYQDYNSRVEMFKSDPSKFDYIKELKYQPNQLYFNLNEDNIESYDDLNAFIPEFYFSTRIDEPNILKLDKASKPNVDENDETQFISKTYYNIHDINKYGSIDKFNEYQYFLKIPTAYPETESWTNSESVYGEFVHGVYKPNTYFYKDEFGNFIMDDSSTMSRSIYFTVNLPTESSEDSTEEKSYILKITYEKAPISEVDGIVNGYESGLYYYVKSGQDITLDQILQGQVSESNVVLATGDYNNLKNNESVAKFTDGNSEEEFFLFKRDYRYELNTVVSYDIVAKQIKLKEFATNSIFIPQFDNSLGQVLTGFKFLTRDELPVTKWVQNEDGTSRLGMFAPPKEVIGEDGQITLVEEEYTELYSLGLIVEGNNAADKKRLIQLSDISKAQNRPLYENYHITREIGTFFESGTYHYHPSNTINQNESYFLDNGYIKQQQTNPETGLADDILYYDINIEDISLVPGTFDYIEDRKFAQINQNSMQNNIYYYCTNPEASDNDKIFKPIVTGLDSETMVYTVKPKIKAFYEPNQYYIKLPDGTYALSRSEDMPEGITEFYERNGIYVIEDPNGYYTKGAEWNLLSENFYPGVVLGTREEKYTLEKVRSFARNENTMHGLILKINQILESYDNETRDITTVRGCINQLNDIIARFDEMKTGEFMLVDEYGRMHSAGWTTKQAFNTTNEQISQVDVNASNTDTQEKENRWISLETDPTYHDPSITVKHMYNPVDNTETISDMNGEAAIEETKAGNNNGLRDSIDLYTPIVDNTGHVVGKNTETITLPYGYKHYKTAGAVDTADADIYTEVTTVEGGANTSETVGVEESTIQASNTQDELTIAPANKWIQTKFEEDTLKIAHEIHAINTEAQETDLNDLANKTFKVHDLEFDAAGHVIKNQEHTYKVPYGFKNINVMRYDDSSAALSAPQGTESATIAADSHVDTLHLASGNHWIQVLPTAGSDRIRFCHTAPSSSTTGYGDLENQNPNFGDSFKTIRVSKDATGHIYQARTNTVTLPKPSLTNGTGNIVTGLSLTPETGAFVEAKADVGTLPITGFDPSIAASVLQVTDSINTALAKLQSRIADNEKTVADLDVNDTAIAGQYVSSVTQADGKITVNRASLTDALNNTYAPLEGSVNTSSEFSYEAGAADDASKTIEWLFKKVADLEAEIEALKSV